MRTVAEKGRIVEETLVRGASVAAIALFPPIGTGSLLWVSVAIGGGHVFVAMMYGPQAAFLAEMFSTDVRYSGASLGCQFGAIFGGALAPLIATELLVVFGSTVCDLVLHCRRMRDHCLVGVGIARDARCRSGNTPPLWRSRWE
jgi:hypothetical protein